MTVRNTTFIYALCEPDSPTRTVRYIGKANNPKRRLQNHLSGAKRGINTHRHAWLRSLIARETVPVIVVLRKVLFSEWQEWERRYIQAARILGMDLTNTTDGGEGVMDGRKHTSETRAKMRASSKKGEDHYMFGKHHSLEARRKIGVGTKGKKLRPEHRAKIKAAALTGPDNPNFGKKPAGASSRFLGVSWHSKTKKWRVRSISGEHMGLFVREEDAAQVAKMVRESIA